MIQIENGTIGTSAYVVTEPDAPDFSVRVTDASGNSVPRQLETDVMLMGSFDAEGSQLAIIEVPGRAGLIAWYVEHVGYSPDEDIGGKTPILELIDRAGSHIALRLQAELDREREREAKPREPLPPGSVIEYCGMQAEVVRDYGGDGKLIVRADDGSRVEWRWNFDGESCKVISRPDEPQAPSEKTYTLSESELRKLLQAAWRNGFDSTSDGLNAEWNNLADGQLDEWAQQTAAELISKQFAASSPASASKGMGL